MLRKALFALGGSGWSCHAKQVPGRPDLAGRAGLPVSITHGALDSVIRVEFDRAARDRLAEAGST